MRQHFPVESHLKHNQHLCHLLIANLPVATAILDCHLNYLLASQRWLSAFGLNQQDIIGRSHAEVLPQYSKLLKVTCQRCLTEGIDLLVEEPFQQTDGSTGWRKWEIRPWREETGEISGLILATEEITARKQAEEALAINQKRFRDTAANLPGVIFQFTIRNDVWTIDYMSEGICNLMGVTAEAVMADMNAFICHVHPDDLESYYGSGTVAVEQLTPWHYEGRLIKPNGEVRWWRGHSMPTKNEQGEVIFCGVLLDITAQKEAETALKQVKTELEGRVEERTLKLQQVVTRLREEIQEREQVETALRESEAELQAIIDNCPAVIYLKDAEGRMIRVNRQFEDLFHKTSAEVKGKTSYDLFPEELAEQFIENDRKLMAEGKPILEEEMAPHDDGLHTYLSSKFPIFNAEGVAYAMGGISTDITERKALETQLAVQKARFDAFFKGANAGLMILDLELRYVHINEALAELNGIPAANHLGKSLRQMLPALAPTLEAMFQGILETGQPLWDNELVGETPKQPGVTRHWLASYYPLIGEAGEIFGFGGVIIEISDRKKAEEELRLSMERYRFLSDSMPQIIWTARSDGGLDYYNQRFYDYTNLTFEQARDWGWQPILHPDDVQNTTERWTHSVTTGEDYQVENRLKRAVDGVYRWHLVRAFPMRNQEGEILQWVGTCTDIDDQKRAEQALRLSSQQLTEQAQREQLINRLTQQIRKSLDFNVILETTLEEVKKFFQIERCQFSCYQGNVEEPYWDVITEAYAPHLTSTTGRYPASAFGLIGTKVLKLETLQVLDIELVDDLCFQEAVRALNIRSLLATPIQLSSNVIGLITCSHSTAARDWTESEVELLQAIMEQLAIALNQAELYTQSRTKAQELEQTLGELQQTQAQLVQTEKMSSLGQLVAGVAHEINNPVNFIYGNLTHANEYMQDLLRLLEMYQQHYPNPHPEIQEEAEAVDLEFLMQDLPKLLSSMKVGADRIQKIVLALRNFSRMDEADVKEINIHEGIDSTLMILHNRMKDKPEHRGIEVIKEYGTLPLVECYAGQLNQVFMNVISNAIDALDERDSQRSPQEIKNHPSSITIRTQALNPQQVQIRIADNGSGMPENVRRRLFEPFFTTKSVGKGTGLGLSISYQVVVDKHGGQMECLSSPGNGAEFVITLPRVAKPSLQTA